MSMSNYLENKVNDAVFGGTVLPVWANLFIGLHTSNPTEAGNVGELTIGTGAYARVSVANNTTQWPNASGGSKSNANPVTFPTPTTDWGDVGWFTVWDAASGGNCLMVSDQFLIGGVAGVHHIQTGNTVSFAAGALVVAAD